MRPTLAAAIALPLLFHSAQAHHGWGSYDATKPLTISATIDQVTIGNPHGDLVLTRDHREMLEANIAVEREVTRDYTEQIPELDDPGLQSLLERIRDHEIHHVQAFQELLEEVTEEESGEEPAPPNEAPEAPREAEPRRAPSVGSLKG